MNWTVLKFGKYEGKTLPQVIFKDPDWFFYFYQVIGFKTPRLQEEAKEIYKKSRNIIVPSINGTKRLAEYAFLPYNQTFVHLELVPETRPPHEGSALVFRSDKIDFGFIYWFNNYDKSGYQRFVRDVKYYLFGSSKYMMTKERCEDFFSCESHFS